MHPIFLQLGPLKIHWYGVFMALAFLAGFANWIRVGRRVGFSAPFCSDLLFWVMVSGILGGRIAYILANAAYYQENPGRVFAIWEGGLIFYGGLIGAVAAVYLFGRSRGVRFLALMDFSITSLPLAHAFGRVGCFMNSCCFGAPLPRWPGVCFPAGVDSGPWVRQIELGLITRQATQSLPVHPVQLYEALWNLALFPLLLWLHRRRPPNGTVMAAYFLVYPLGRLWFEAYRGTERLMIGPLSVAQALSLGMMALGVILLLTRTTSNIRHPTSETMPER